jgi:hypothetical protein
MYSLQGSPLIGQAIDLATKASLQHRRDLYFDCLLACTGLVGLGLLMEILEIKHDILEAIGRKSREGKYWLALPIDRREYPEASPRAKVLSAVGWVLIVVGVTGEGVFEGFVSKYDTALSRVTDTVVAEAQKESANAEATAKGFDAQIAESDAKAKSAEAIAKGFEAQIADAKARAAQAELELARIKTPRSLTHVPELVATLKPFKGTKYLFFGLFGDEESANLLRQIDGVLQGAEWTRVQPPSPFPPVLNLSLGSVSIAVTQRFDTGVKITVESMESVASLQSLPLDKVPAYIQAATSLRGSLAPRIFPPQNGIGDTINVLSGNEPFVLITVGKKP